MQNKIQVLSSKDMFWEALGLKLKAHAESFGEASCRAEVASEEQVQRIETIILNMYVVVVHGSLSF